MKDFHKTTVLIAVFLFWIFYAPLISKAQHSNPEINYAQTENWIFIPDDPQRYECDVFYVYPTVFFGDTAANMDLNSPELREKALGVAIEHSGVFSEVANVYAPFYSQVSIAVLSLDDQESKPYMDIAFKDVETAFEYYIEHLNNGRPFFLAGHSQGSDMLLMLMKKHFNDDDLANQLIAAYTIGFSITDEELAENPWMKIAQKKDDLGVIITYNTQSPDATGSPVLLPGAKCVNPLSWNTTLRYAPKAFNLGAAFFNDDHKINTTIIEYTDAIIDKNGALAVSGPDPDDFYEPGVSFFPRGVFHAYDYNFFYFNLKENVKTRWHRYKNK